jgi:hypothetical protein
VRTWRTPDGQLLVEGPAVATEIPGGPIRTAADQPVAGAFDYYLIDAAATVREAYTRSAGAIDDYSYGCVHRVVGSTLVEYVTEYHTVPHDVDADGQFRRTNTEHERLTGLVAAPGAIPPAAVEAALQAHREASEREGPVDDVRSSFAAALPEVGDGETIDLVFGYDGGPLVRRRDGAVLWRPPAPWPYRGKDLHHVLRQVLDQRYGDRLATFGLDIDDAPWWFWAPDE